MILLPTIYAIAILRIRASVTAHIQSFSSLLENVIASKMHHHKIAILELKEKHTHATTTHGCTKSTSAAYKQQKLINECKSTKYLEFFRLICICVQCGCKRTSSSFFFSCCFNIVSITLL